MVTMIGAINQAEGIAIAKVKGKYKGRKKIEITDELRDLYKQWLNRKLSKKEIIDMTGHSRATIDRRFKELSATV